MNLKRVINRKTALGGLLLLFSSAIFVAQATDYSSTNFIVRDPVIGVGGGRATSTSFEVYSSLGQTAIGQSTSTGFIIRSGFQYYPGPAAGGGAGRTASIQFSPITITTSVSPPLPGEEKSLTEEGAIIFSGKAYPGSRIILLKDAQVAAATVAGSDAVFTIILRGLSGGDYIFGFYAEDNRGTRSLLQTYPLNVATQVAVKVSGIFIAPTVSLDKSEVRKGDPLVISGQTVPQGIITVRVSSQHEFRAVTEADSEGIYAYSFDTTPLTLGRHLAKTQTFFQGEFSPFSKLVTFVVGTKNVAAPKIEELARKSDINGDGRINLVDFSIASYWYKREISEGVEFPKNLDLNGDKKIDLTDFSIMAFYWTG